MADFRNSWQKDIDNIEKEMERLLHHFGTSKPPIVQFDPEVWEPAMDIYEAQNEITVLVELAGMRHEEISVIIEGSRLIVRGERKDPPGGGRRTYYQMEIRHGGFQRGVILPSPVDAEKTKASYKDGILEIVLAKTERKQTPRVRIPI